MNRHPLVTVKSADFLNTLGTSIGRGADWLNTQAQANPAAYGAGLGALVGAGWTAMSPRRKETNSKPWLRNLLIGGAIGGLGMKGLDYAAKNWGTKAPASTINTKVT